jgi:hypothetical protein
VCLQFSFGSRSLLIRWSQRTNDTKCDYRTALSLRKAADFRLFREINFPGVIEIRRLEIYPP